MPSSPGDRADNAAIDPLSVFDDGFYEREVLQLPQGHSEDAFDKQLAIEARERGIAEPFPEAHDISTALSTLTVSSEHRSSLSIRSQESQSTGLTSHPSRTSKDQHIDRAATTPITPPPRASLSIETYNALSGGSYPGMRHSRSSSTASTAAGSTFSMPLKLSTKRKRSSILSMFRRDSTTCSARSRHSHDVGGPSLPTLDCGHNLSQIAVRIHIRDSASVYLWPPRCCGRPIPDSVLEMAMSKEELDKVSHDMSQSCGFDKYPGLASCSKSLDRSSSLDVAISLATKTPFNERSGDATPDHRAEEARSLEEAHTLEQAMKDPDFRTLRAQQEGEAERIVRFEKKQRDSLITTCEQATGTLSSENAKWKSELLHEHAQALEQLEESQISAELEIRKAHAEEHQKVATALKYMEAYVNGRGNYGSEIKHAVTEEDRKKLKRQQDYQNNLDNKHESAINVLRAKQERETKLRMEKQRLELTQTDKECEQKKLALKVQFQRDSQKLEELIQARRRRAAARWDLQNQMWKKEYERKHGAPFAGRLPHPEWPEGPPRARSGSNPTVDDGKKALNDSPLDAKPVSTAT